MSIEYLQLNCKNFYLIAALEKSKKYTDLVQIYKKTLANRSKT